MADKSEEAIMTAAKVGSDDDVKSSSSRPRRKIDYTGIDSNDVERKRQRKSDYYYYDDDDDTPSSDADDAANDRRNARSINSGSTTLTTTTLKRRQADNGDTSSQPRTNNNDNINVVSKRQRISHDDQSTSITGRGCIDNPATSSCTTNGLARSSNVQSGRFKVLDRKTIATTSAVLQGNTSRGKKAAVLAKDKKKPATGIFNNNVARRSTDEADCHEEDSNGISRTDSACTLEKPSLSGNSDVCPRANNVNKSTTKLHRSCFYYPSRILAALLLLGLILLIHAFNPIGHQRIFSTSHPHILIPHHHLVKNNNEADVYTTDDAKLVSNRTLREFISDENGYHLAMAPAFFGFYGYFGALAAWEDGIGRYVLENRTIQSVTGASAGAMAAVLLAAGVPPRVAANFCAGITLGRFNDFPGLGAVFQGNKFERIMFDFLNDQVPGHSLLMEDADLDVSVSAFDLRTMRGRILQKGPMARAARASATFPFLFQPVSWENDTGNDENYLLIDGGITDYSGLNGLEAFLGRSNSSSPNQRVVNLSVGDFLGGTPPGPSSIINSEVEGNVDVLSISIRNLPQCGPWAMSNGPRAVDAAYQAMLSSLDVPLHHGHEKNHYELHIDTQSFQ